MMCGKPTFCRRLEADPGSFWTLAMLRGVTRRTAPAISWTSACELSLAPVVCHAMPHSLHAPPAQLAPVHCCLLLWLCVVPLPACMPHLAGKAVCGITALAVRPVGLLVMILIVEQHDSSACHQVTACWMYMCRCTRGLEPPEVAQTFLASGQFLPDYPSDVWAFGVLMVLLLRADLPEQHTQLLASPACQGGNPAADPRNEPGFRAILEYLAGLLSSGSNYAAQV